MAVQEMPTGGVGFFCELDLWLSIALFPAGEFDTDVQSVQRYHKEGECSNRQTRQQKDCY